MADFSAVRLHRALRIVGAAAMIGGLNAAASAATATLTTPGPQSWIVPVSVTSITVVAVGGGGGGGWGAAGGNGGQVTSTLSVTPGQNLTINIGGGGIGTASEGGGGGGATSIDPGTAWQIIAGGGGGGGGKAGGDGNGSNGVDGSGAAGTGGHGGSGGTGGAGGINVSRPTCAAAVAGGSGNGGPGGGGGSDNASVAAGAGGTGVGSGTGGPAAHQPGACAPGGGGGGYGGGGGGGGASNDGGGGGGGSAGPAGSVISVGSNRGAANVTGGNGSVTITYSDRSLSLAIDGSVKGTIAAQAASAIRFAETQIRNVTDHINQIGSDFSLNGNRLAVGLNLHMPREPARATQLLLAAADAKWASTGLATRTDVDSPKYAGLDDSAANNPTEFKGDQHQSLRSDERDMSGPRYAFWAAGDISDGQMDVGSGTNKFHTDGITLGLDFMLSPKAIVGAAVGYGRDHTDIDSLGSRVRANQRSFIAYGVYEPEQGLLLDGLLGMGDLAMSNSRFSALSNAVLASDRKGFSTYGAIGLSYPLKIKGLNAKPYLRASYLDVTLDAYNEGGDVNALAFDRAKVKSTSVFAGFTVSNEIYSRDGGKWIPNAKFELRRNTKGSIDQSINFADTPSEAAILRVDSTPQNVQTLGLGVRYLQKHSVNLGLSWLGSVGSDSYRASMVKVDLLVPF